jgi:hypothetical protein
VCKEFREKFGGDIRNGMKDTVIGEGTRGGNAVDVWVKV